MNSTLFVLVLLIAQVTPPPPPPVLFTPAPSPSAAATPASPSASPGATPAASPAASPQASPAPSPSASALAAAPAALDLHPLQAQSVTVTGASGAISAQADSPLVSVSVDSAAQTVTVTAGPQTGRAGVTISDTTGAAITVPVRVALDAATVPSSITLQVTGNSVDPLWLRTQISAAIGRAVQLQPGAGTLQLGAFTPPALFTPGSTAAVPVRVSVAGGTQYYDVNAATTVNLQNVDAGGFTPPLLMYDDDPEKIVANGVLFQGEVTARAPARLYYYHQDAGDPRRLAVVLSAAGPQSDPAAVQLIDASAGPSMDVMSVGHAVSRDFLMEKPQNEGVVAEVGPGAPYVADAFSMAPLDGAAGSIGIRLLSGGPVQVTVVAAPAGTPDAALAGYAAQPRLPGDGHHRTGLFDLAGYGAQTLDYAYGGPDAMLQYGVQTPPALAGTTGHDYGEYGVLRTLTFDVSNPTAQSGTVYLYERPMGGDVRSSFLVDGTLVQLGCARLSARYQIGQAFSLAPGGRYQITVQTMTDGGSSYPLEVGLTATPPQPATPPISAPDGCFPKPAASPGPQAPSSPSPVPSAPAVQAVPVPEPTGRTE